MANLTCLLHWKGKLNACDAAIWRAEDKRDVARNEMREVLVRCRAAEGLSLRQAADALMCSASTLHDIENGRRWSEGIVNRAVDYYAARMRARTALADDGDYHDACESALAQEAGDETR